MSAFEAVPSQLPMLPAELERYLHTHIPLTQAMRVGVVSVALESVTLCAPLAPNINHRETAFGGSAAALAILAAWGLLHVRLQAAGSPARLVIQRHSMEFTRPITGEFIARSALVEAQRWSQFTAMLARRGRARVSASATLECAGACVGEFSGEFVALNDSR